MVTVGDEVTKWTVEVAVGGRQKRFFSGFRNKIPQVRFDALMIDHLDPTIRSRCQNATSPPVLQNKAVVCTMMNRCFVCTLIVALFASMSHGFVVKAPSVSKIPPTALQAHSIQDKLVKAATAAAIVASMSPLVALAEEDYEYGAVNAPIGLAWGVGVLAILTALLPIALRGGEEAFEEMKDRDKDAWGTGGKDTLNKRK